MSYVLTASILIGLYTGDKLLNVRGRYKNAGTKIEKGTKIFPLRLVNNLGQVEIFT